MNRTMLTMLTILIASTVIFYGCQSKEPSAKSETGKTAQEFTLANYDGKNVSLSDYNGKIVVLEWFNYECPFVKYHYEKAKTMVALANKYKGKNVVWLAINSTGHLTAQQNKEFANKHKFTYPILDDRTGKTGRDYGAETTPNMFIIDTTGRIVYPGAIDNSPMGEKTEGVINYVDNALAELTTDKSISVSNTKPYGCSIKYAD